MSRTGLLAETRERQHRRRVGIELLDRRLLDGLRQQRQDAVDLVAHFLRRDVGVLLEQERDDDLRDAFGRGRAQLVDAADGVDRFLDLVGDLGLDFLRRRAGQARGDDDGREVDLRKRSTPSRVNANAPMTVSDRMRTVAKTGRLTESAASHCMTDLPRRSERALPSATAVAAVRFGRDALAGLRRPLVISMRSPTVSPSRDDPLFDLGRRRRRRRGWCRRRSQRAAAGTSSAGVARRLLRSAPSRRGPASAGRPRSATTASTVSAR